MRSSPFGPLGRHVPVIGIGTWNMERDDPRAARAALHRALDLGAAHVDTAELYGQGQVESLVGEALRGRRDEVFLVSKVLPDHASRRGAVQACEASLRRLGVERLDLYLLHWEGPHPLEDTFAAFEALVAAGKIGAWGVSNFDAPALQEAIDLVGPGRIAANQVLYHLGERSIEHAVLPLCEAHDIALVGYSPFGSGDFPGPGSEGGARLAEIGAAHGASARQVALAFLTRRGSLFAIPKTSSAARVEENVGASELILSEEELLAIEAAFPLGEDSGELPMI